MTEQRVGTRDIEASVYGVPIQEEDVLMSAGVDKAEKGVKILSWKSPEPGTRYRILAAVREEDGAFVSYCLNLPGAVS